ncbi:hypothetical protein ABIA39_000454 [Nocardia sp. GAS34]|uniref:hypothetical protein n=1 Tax=unclassified Nocardia TaxID=2637762 RepID=UPI003D20B007
MADRPYRTEQDQSIPIDLSSRRTVDIAPNAVLKEYIDAGHGLYQSHYAQVRGRHPWWMTVAGRPLAGDADTRYGN